jgi:dTDP-4-amino-4,6-dideoxygalactose transaminase/CelD/BcsL family acetyltransferase involved in cellulose biosynthesis
MPSSRLGVWPSLPLGVYLRRPFADVPFPLAERGSVVVSLARHGLWLGMVALGLDAGDEILTPAYHHGSEIEALIQAGLVCRFYDASPRLEPDEAELETLVNDRTRGLHLTHYLGFPQDADRWRRWCDERGLVLIEDAAQAWLAHVGGNPVGSRGDLSIFCLYKTYGLPDGAAVLSRAPIHHTEENGRPLLAKRLLRRHAAWLAERSGSFARAAERFESPGEYDAEADFALGDPASPPSSTTAYLLPRVLSPDTAARRRAHYGVMLEALGAEVPEPFDELPDGASPFALPLATDDKEALLTRLRMHGVIGADFWSVPHPSLDVAAYPRSAKRRAETVTLPVHQELNPYDIERIVRAAQRRRAPREPSSDRLQLEPFESLDGLRGEWSELAERTDNIFSTWEWNATWWRHFGGDRRLLGTACRSADGHLVAVLPLFFASKLPLRVVRFTGAPPADELGPICEPARRFAAARALRDVLERLRFDVFIGEQLVRDAGWGALLGATTIRRTGSPVLRFQPGESWDDVLASRSANFRQQVRRRRRNLERTHDVRFRMTEDRSQLEHDLDILFALHSRRWHAGDSSFSALEAFHRDFAAEAFERGWLRLRVLELDGQPVAAWYGFRFGGVESYYQAGWDPAFNESSVGFVLLAHSVRAALEDGAREYRFLEGTESYKYRFTQFDPGLETVALARTALGVAALRLATLVGRRSGFVAFGRRVVGAAPRGT